MLLDHDTCYRALTSHDPRFDGVFFVGVATTGIYCRTVCPARQPKPESCRFYPSAAAAERAGFRPCLRCRPELAPGSARVDSAGRLAAAALARIEDGALGDATVAELAAELGVTDRHLRRVVREEFGVSVIELAQTQRLLMAKRLLTDTALPVSEIAFAAGFSSLRRFNALFSERYRLNPTALRRKAAMLPVDVIRCEVAFRPPLDWHALLAFLSTRCTPGVEAVTVWDAASSVPTTSAGRNLCRDAGCCVPSVRYLRTLRIGEHAGWVAASLSISRPAVVLEVCPSLARVLPGVIARARRAFDLAADPLAIASRLGALAEPNPGLRVPGAFDGFEMAVRAILGQQVSVKGATTLAGRLAAEFGEALETPLGGIERLSPTAEELAPAGTARIASIGLPTARAASIHALAVAAADGRIAPTPGGDVERTMSALKTLPGIGEWTAQYVAMRALAWPDGFPHSDLGILKALGEKDPRRALDRAETWRPWRAYAAMHLWRSLETAK